MNDVRAAARRAGILWLIVIIVSIISVAEQSTQPRLAFAATQLGGVCYLGVTVLLYELFRSIRSSVSAFGAACGIAGVACGAALDMVPSGAQAQGFAISMVFFGAQILTIGYLITRSTLIPRALGVLLVLGGLSYLIFSFTSFLSPAVGTRIMPFIIPIAILGEGSLTVWLLIKGVKQPHEIGGG
jgi:hypothetical protein